MDFVIFLEFLGSKSRGFYATLIILFGIFGVIATAGLGWAVIDPLGWRWYLVICTAPFLIVLFFRILWKHESPRYLLVSGKTDEAMAVLQAAAARNKTKVLLPLLFYSPVVLSQYPRKYEAPTRSATTPSPGRDWLEGQVSGSPEKGTCFGPKLPAHLSPP